MNKVVMKKKKSYLKSYLWWIIGGVVVAAAIGFFLLRRSETKKDQILEVTKGNAIEALYAIGTVEALRSYQLKAGVAAGIDKIPVREGAEVKKGDTIASFSEGNLIRAPFDGVITRVNFKVGESVFMGNIIAELIDPKQLQVKVVLDQRAAVRVKRGLTAILSFDGLRDRKIEGTVRTIYSSDSRFTVMIDTKELPKEILPGMTADVAIEVSRKADATLIPAAAVEKGQVQRLRDGKKTVVPVKSGLVNGDLVELIDGDVKPGDQVVVKAK